MSGIADVVKDCELGEYGRRGKAKDNESPLRQERVAHFEALVDLDTSVILRSCIWRDPVRKAKSERG